MFILRIWELFSSPILEFFLACELVFSLLVLMPVALIMDLLYKLAPLSSFPQSSLGEYIKDDHQSLLLCSLEKIQREDFLNIMWNAICIVQVMTLYHLSWVWNWKWESESVKVKVWKLKCESVKDVKVKCHRQPFIMALGSVELSTSKLWFALLWLAHIRDEWARPLHCAGQCFFIPCSISFVRH